MQCRPRANPGLHKGALGERQSLFKPGLNFKAVIAVEMPTLPGRQQARRRIGQQEKNTPALVLPHMRLLMFPQPRQIGLAAAKNDMAEGERAKRRARPNRVCWRGACKPC